jgi:hypothetical protein
MIKLDKKTIPKDSESFFPKENGNANRMTVQDIDLMSKEQ